jgi:hypothetical protein
LYFVEVYGKGAVGTCKVVADIGNSDLPLPTVPSAKK